ncbi:MAG: NTP transferase domain-containing protein [Hyphomonadaceae bacterium]|nr:NTP transferase domain-containing protein [Hyphomonadaceae bacterium]MBC6412674.1 NTP transferase domain-containing protein [Hyphomonadaceae bacterium]
MSHTALVFLAGGLSRRFGRADKLLADFRDKPLMLHAVQTALICQFAMRFAVVPAGTGLRIKNLEQDFVPIENKDPGTGRGRSLSLGARACLDTGYTSACVMLADMPFVTHEHIGQLMANAAEHEITISRTGNQVLPPAVFCGRALRDLTTLAGDKGASALDFTRYCVKYVDMSKHQAVDIDTAEDLRKYGSMV